MLSLALLGNTSYFSKLALLPHNIWALQNIDLILKATYLLQ